MSTLGDELNNLLKDAASEEEQKEIVTRFFEEKAAFFQEKIRDLSDDELDSAVGGREIGDPYAKCVDDKLYYAAKSYSINTDIFHLYC